VAASQFVIAAAAPVLGKFAALLLNKTTVPPENAPGALAIAQPNVVAVNAPGRVTAWNMYRCGNEYAAHK